MIIDCSWADNSEDRNTEAWYSKWHRKHMTSYLPLLGPIRVSYIQKPRDHRVCRVCLRCACEALHSTECSELKQ